MYHGVFACFSKYFNLFFVFCNDRSTFFSPLEGDLKISSGGGIDAESVVGALADEPEDAAVGIG